MRRLRPKSRWLGVAAIGAVISAAALTALHRDSEPRPCPLSPAACSRVDVAAPDPGGDEGAGLPAPPPGDKLFGFNDDPGPLGAGPAILDGLAKVAGADAIRFPLDWRLVEPTPGVWDERAWAYHRDAYDSALAAGLTPVIDFGFAPPWARDPGPAQACQDFFVCRFPPAVSMDSAWARFASEVARRFPRAVLEVWNEPNIIPFWHPSPDPERFAQLQAIAYRAIKAVNPSITVLAGGLAATQEAGTRLVPPGSGDMPVREFLDRAYAARPGLRGHMDGLSFHPYPYALDLGEGSVFAKEFADVRGATVAHGDRGVPLWVTEVGIPTSGAHAVSEAQQAALLVRLYERLATMDDVAGIFIHRLLPPANEGPASTEAGYALLRPGTEPFAPKPAFCEFVGLAGDTYPEC